MTGKPTKFPEWATTLTNNPTSGQDNRVEPSAGVKDLGFDYQEIPPRQYTNYQLWLINQWVEHFARSLDQFAPHEAATPNMTVVIDAGILPTAVGVLAVNQQTTAAFTAPTTNPRIDVLCINRTTGVYYVQAGTEAATPTAPDVDTRTYMVIAKLTLTVGMLTITNATNIDDVRLASDQIIYPAVSGYVSGITTYIESDSGAGSTGLDITSVIADSTWESVGPTGSSADNIWTAMDSIPVGAKAVIIKVVVYAYTSTSLPVEGSIYGRVTGSSTVIGDQTRIAGNAGDATLKLITDTNTAQIPIDSSRRFDLNRVYQGNGALTANAYLVGFII